MHVCTSISSFYSFSEKIESLLLTARMSPAVIAAAINTLLQLCTVLKPQQYQVCMCGCVSEEGAGVLVRRGQVC